MTSGIVADLTSLGIRSGDTLLVTADIRYMRLKRQSDGKVPNYAETLLASLLDCVQPSGTVVALSFTGSAFTSAGRKRLGPFTAKTPASTGSFVEAVLRHSDVKRSAHPTNSFAAIGASADRVIRFHTPYAHSHRPVEELIALGGKQLVLGCVETVPGFSTVHLAQHHLGLTERSLIAGRTSALYLDTWGTRRVFRKRDVPGCSLGFGKLYYHYRTAGAMSDGHVAGAPSVLGKLGECYDLALESLRRDPTCVFCDDPACIDCRLFKTYSRDGRLEFIRARLKHAVAQAQSRTSG